MSTEKTKICNFAQTRQLNFYAKLTKADKVSSSAKRKQYGYAEEEKAEEKISTERANQGARAPLDRESAPKKRKK